MCYVSIFNSCAVAIKRIVNLETVSRDKTDILASRTCLFFRAASLVFPQPLKKGRWHPNLLTLDAQWRPAASLLRFNLLTVAIENPLAFSTCRKNTSGVLVWPASPVLLGVHHFSADSLKEILWTSLFEPLPKPRPFLRCTLCGAKNNGGSVYLSSHHLKSGRQLLRQEDAAGRDRKWTAGQTNEVFVHLTCDFWETPLRVCLDHCPHLLEIH